MKIYATVDDLQTRWRTLQPEEVATATQLLEDASAKIRNRANKLGKDFDFMVDVDEDLEAVVKTIICKAVANSMKMNDTAPFTQFAESAGGYSVSGTYFIPGGGISFSKTDWRELGLGVQRFGGLDIWG